MTPNREGSAARRTISLCALALGIGSGALPAHAQTVPTKAPSPSAGGPVEFRYDAPWAGERSRQPDGPDRRDAAARQEFPSDAPCRWLPPLRSGAGPTAAQAARASPTEAQALRANIARIERFFRDDPRFASPLGLCMQFANGGWRGEIEGGHALQGSFSIGAWPGEWLYRRNGRLVFDGETAHIHGSVNRMPVDRNNSIADARGTITRADSPLLKPVGSHQGFAVYGDGSLVIARADRALFRPASFERLARWVLAELDHRQFEGRRNPTPREQDAAAKAAAVRRALTEALARMNEVERAAPGCFVADEVEFGSRIGLVVSATDPRCATRMVEPDPDYFDRRLPPSAIQLVTLWPFRPDPPQGGVVGAPRASLRAHWMVQALFWGTDWAAFRDAILATR